MSCSYSICVQSYMPLPLPLVSMTLGNVLDLPFCCLIVFWQKIGLVSLRCLLLLSDQLFLVLLNSSESLHLYVHLYTCLAIQLSSICIRCPMPIPFSLHFRASFAYWSFPKFKLLTIVWKILRTNWLLEEENQQSKTLV